MKGVIFNVLEEFIVEHWGEAVYEEILGQCPVHMHAGHIGPGTYADADMVTIVTKTCERLGVAPDDALRLFGRYLFPRLLSRYPAVAAGIDDPYELLKRIDDAIHVEVRKLVPGAVTPRILCSTDAGELDMTVTYQSARKLCSAFTGLLQGVGDHFGLETEYRQMRCMKDGADCCRFDLRFSAAHAVT